MKYIIYAIIIISVAACRRGMPDYQECEKGQLNPTIETYFASTREGSVWVYVAQGTSDTEIVRQTGYSECNGGATLNFESTFGVTWRQEIHDNHTSARFNDNDVSSHFGESVSNDSIIIYSPEEYIGEFVISGKAYQEVYHLYDNNPFFTEYYVAPEVGIIRKKEHVNGPQTPRVFDLVETDLKR